VFLFLIFIVKIFYKFVTKLQIEQLIGTLNWQHRTRLYWKHFWQHYLMRTLNIWSLTYLMPMPQVHIPAPIRSSSESRTTRRVSFYKRLCSRLTALWRNVNLVLLLLLLLLLLS